ncbi:MAG: alpha/beta fold hydrolase [Gemmatimonadetes bacterium]|nr:alpha/beta fold hydrolase [Gemmatimonadota bacterium]
MLHGGPGAHHDYLLPQLLDLTDEFELVFYDQRGGGRSRVDDPAPITWRTHVEDAAQVATELCGGSGTVVGYSWGALLAALHAIEHRAGRAPAGPRAFALLDPAPMTRAFRNEFEAEFARRARSDTIATLRAEAAASGLRERDPAAYKQRMFELSVAPYFARAEAATGLTPFRVTGRVQDQVWESLGDFDCVTPLGTLEIPALVVHGRQDPIPLASSQAAAAALRAPLVVLEDCGHVPYVEQREPLMNTLRPFLHSVA